MKREIPIMITFVVCLFLILDFVIQSEFLSKVAGSINDYTSIVATFAMVLGLGSLFSVHLNRIYRKRMNWVYSIILILGFAVAVFFATLYGVDETYTVQLSQQEYEQREAKGEKGLVAADVYYLLVQNKKMKVSKEVYELSALSAQSKATGKEYKQIRKNKWFDGLIFKGIYDPLQATMFSLLAFFMASAAYRAFRAKSLEATLLLVSAFLVMLGRVPIGAVVGDMLAGMIPFLGLEGSHWFKSIADFIMTVPNAAGQRAIMIGAALGMVAASFRIWFAYETEHLGRD